MIISDAKEEIQFHGRRRAAERELLELIFAANGSTRQAVAIATAEGICQWSFAAEDHRLLWLAAQIGRDNSQAVWLAREALVMFGLWDGDLADGQFDQFLDAWFWCTPKLRSAARQLRSVECSEAEAGSRGNR